MKICILTLGTRGDVQPYIALGKGLKQRGHDVLLGASGSFQSWIEGHGLRFHGLGFDIEAFLRSDEARRAMSGRWLALARIWQSRIKPMMRHMLEASVEAADGAELIIYHPKVAGAPDIAEASGARLICAATIPLFPTSSFPVPIWGHDFGSWLNRQSYALFRLSRLPYRRLINDWRREQLGLGRGALFPRIASFAGGKVTSLCMVSPSVVPRPDDWEDHMHMTGYWFLDEGRDWTPDPMLQTFLDAGEPPVYIGFGSMASKDPAHITKVVLQALEQTGLRAILATGWGGLCRVDLPGNVHMIDAAPHDALFRHVRAVVHHGGAGSTAAGLRAGLPTLVCPLTVDQPFWGKRVRDLGCGPEPQSLRRLAPDRLAAGLEALVTDQGYRDQASALAGAIASEDGVGSAIDVIETDVAWL